MDKKAYYNKSGFTLIEILVGILIFSIVFVGGFQAMTSVSYGKVKLIETTKMEKEALYLSEKLFDIIKKGGTIDYEEYFNRKVVGNTTFTGGHFDIKTGFGNYGTGGIIGNTTYGNEFYYCASSSSKTITSTGCYITNIGKYQRYGEYSLQFIDYNSNADNDNGTPGDEDGDGNIIGDQDDLHLGDGPTVFSGGINTHELYLISGDKKERTLIRWTVKNDIWAPTGSTCSGGENPTGDGCLGTIEFLKLTGKDYGLNHDISTLDTDGTQYDGIIDTRLIHPDFTGSNNDIVAGSNNTNYWLPLFGENINVQNFKIEAYPNKDLKYTWKDSSPSTNISPYVRLSFKITPGWKTRRNIKGPPPVIDFSTTISLTEIFSQ